jgi:hypothetical protein
MPGTCRFGNGEISPLALATGPVVAAVPAHADTLPLLPLGNTGTDLVDDARHFMSGSAGI